MVPEEVARPLILEVHEAYAHIGKKKVQKMLEEDILSSDFDSAFRDVEDL